LLDRFGLSVDVASPREIASRIEVLKRRDAYEQDPDAFHALWEKDEQRLARRIVAGRKAVATVELSERSDDHDGAFVHAAGCGWAAWRTHIDACHPRQGRPVEAHRMRPSRMC
jgi:Mg-chelatase subunit ChlI